MLGPLTLTFALVCGLARSAHAQACPPGGQVPCTCEGAVGVQACSENGSLLGPCQCAAPPPPPVVSEVPLAEPTAVPPAPEPPPPPPPPPTPAPVLPQAPSSAPPEPTASVAASGQTTPATTQAAEVPALPLGRTWFSVYLGASLLYGKSKNPAFKVAGIGFDFGVGLEIGVLPTFPDANGGNWHGAELRLRGSLHQNAVIYPDDFAGMFFPSGHFSLGYEFLHFRPARAGERQRGIGAAFAFRTGFQYSLFTNSELELYAGTDPTLGLTLSLVIPKYDVTKRHLHRALVDLDWWRLPGTEVSFLTLSAGVAF
jgi:hypothetical protein